MGNGVNAFGEAGERLASVFKSHPGQNTTSMYLKNNPMK
jgi:acetoacetate decarboxylase